MFKLNRKSISIIAAAAALTVSGSAGAASLHKTVTVNVDGQEKKVSGFLTGSVQELLLANGIQFNGNDRITPAIDMKLAEGMKILVSHARTVKVQDGKNDPKEVITLAGTVEELLAQAGIQLGQHDRVSVDLQSTPVSDKTIVITRRDVKVEVAEEKIPFQTERQPNEDIDKGQEKMLTRGVEGSAKVTTTIIYENGEEVDRQVQREVASEPQKAVVAYGTKVKPVVVASRSGAPTSSSRTLSMSATAYVAGGTTATGRPAAYGIAAVDPSVIPLGTKLYIEGYGYAIAADTGGAIKGNKIDLVFNTYEEAVAFGRRQVIVTILD